MIQIRYEITSADYLEMLKEVRFTFRRQIMRIFVCLFGLMVSVLGYAYFGPSWIALAAFFVVLIGFQIAMPNIVHWRVYNRNRRLFGMRTTTFDDEGAKTDSDIHHIQTKWANFEGFKETSHLFLVFQTRDVAGIVPKRAFANEAAIEQFRNLISSKIPAAR